MEVSKIRATAHMDHQESERMSRPESHMVGCRRSWLDWPAGSERRPRGGAPVAAVANDARGAGSSPDGDLQAPGSRDREARARGLDRGGADQGRRLETKMLFCSSPRHAM